MPKLMMPKLKSLFSHVSICILGLTAATAHAESELQLNLPFYFFDGIPIDNNPGVGLGYGYRFDNPMGVELAYNHLPSELSSSGIDADLAHWQLNGLYHFATDSDVTPFVLLGVGNMDVDIAGAGSDDTLASALGFGAKYDFADNWRFRSDARWFHTDDGSDDVYALTLGIAYVFGKTTKSVRTERAVAPSQPTPTDSDADGVNDNADQCSATPRGVDVDMQGCPLDSDDDGVADYQDRCPNTTARVRVDASGCPVMLEETVSIELEVHFDTNSDEVKASYYPEIRKVADFLAQYENTNAVIEGHSDARGDASYNKQLSQRRADSVRAVLVNQMNVNDSRVRAVGYGEERLLRVGDHDANRRVVAEISASVEKPATTR